MSSTNFSELLENDLDISSKFLNLDVSIDMINSSMSTSIYSDAIVNEENDKKIILMIIEKILIPVKAKKGCKNKIKLKLFQISLDSGATDYVILLYLVSCFEKVNFKMKT